MPRRRFPIIPLALSLGILLLALIFILGIYLSMGGGGSSPRDTTTNTRLTLLDHLMQQYQAVNPPLTAATAPDPASSWVQALQNCPQTAPQIRPLITQLNHLPVILDGHGNPIRFITADRSPVHGAYFQSTGRDALPNTADDLFSTGPHD